jgi:hypothetical protein
MLSRKPDGAERSEIDASPLDRPLNRTYLGVIAVEVIVIVLLVIVGRMFS